MRSGYLNRVAGSYPYAGSGPVDATASGLIAFGGATNAADNVVSINANVAHRARSTIPITGKIYVEFTCSASGWFALGVCNQDPNFNWNTNPNNTTLWYTQLGTLLGSGGGSLPGAGSTGNLNIGMAIDPAAQKVWFRKGSDGSWINGDPVTGVNGMSWSYSATALYLAVGVGSAGATPFTMTLNAGQSPMTWPAPSGFVQGLYGVPSVPPLMESAYDPHTLYNDECLSTTGWSTKFGSPTIVQKGSEVGLIGANSSIQKTVSYSVTSQQDHIFYVRFRSLRGAGKFGSFNLLSGGATILAISLGYNWPSGAAEDGTISVWGSTGPFTKVLATGQQYDTDPPVFAIHVDRDRSAIMVYRKLGGLWVFQTHVTWNVNIASITSVVMDCSAVGTETYIDYLSVCRPGVIAIGDSICAGANQFDPNPAVIAGNDNNDTTWMKWARLNTAQRNSLVVNKGVGSQSSASLLSRIAEATNHKPKIVFIHASSNDFVLGLGQAPRKSNIQNTVNAVSAANAIPVLLNAVYARAGYANHPAHGNYMKDSWDNYLSGTAGIWGCAAKINIMAALSDGVTGFMNAAYTDPADNIHPNTSGYTAMGLLIQPQIRQYFDEVTKDFPLSYWRLDEKTGSLLAMIDEMANHNGVRGSIATPGASGLIANGSSYYSDMTTTSPSLVASHSNFLVSGGDFSIELWVKKNSAPPSSSEVYMFVKEQGGVNFPMYSVQFNTSGFAQFVVFPTNGASGAVNVSGAVNICDGAAHHVVAVRDGDTLRLYVDGVQVSTAPFTGSIWSSSDPIGIASSYAPGISRGLKGWADEVAFYRHALPAARVTAHYAARSSA